MSQSTSNLCTISGQAPAGESGPTRPAQRRRSRCGRLGIAATEFAIVAPVFFLLVIGIIELGRALMVQQILTNASRVGARTAVMLNATSSEVIDTATTYAQNVSVTGVDVDVSPDPSSAQAGDEVQVIVTVPYSAVSWLPAPWFLNNTTLTATSVMRKEGFE